MGERLGTETGTRIQRSKRVEGIQEALIPLKPYSRPTEDRLQQAPPHTPTHPHTPCRTACSKRRPTHLQPVLQTDDEILQLLPAGLRGGLFLGGQELGVGHLLVGSREKLLELLDLGEAALDSAAGLESDGHRTIPVSLGVVFSLFPFSRMQCMESRDNNISLPLSDLRMKIRLQTALYASNKQRERG